MSADPALALDEVLFEYESGKPVVKDFSMTVERGQIVAVVGPSGCGKSTILRMMAGLLQPALGSVGVASPEADSSCALAMVFQEDVLLPWLSVRKNVALHGRYNRSSRDEVNRRSDDLLQMVGLADFADHFPSQLSGGMRRRIGVLQPLAAHPACLLFDEPFSSIDEPTRILIHQDVRKLLKRSGTTAVLVTHDLAEAVSLCDRVLIISGRPTHVVYDKEVDLGTERDMLQVRDDPRYLEIYRDLWEQLSDQISASPAPTEAAGATA